MYTIKVDYQTGNSFGSEETSDIIGISWESLDLAKKALKDIDEHNKSFNPYHFDYHSNKRIDERERKKKSWFYSNQYDTKGEYSLRVLGDDGKYHTISAFWRGYFECLLSAEIILEFEADNDCKIYG